jgi:MinD superfamily P-loop ATPase
VQELVVISGKGGTGKTSVTAALAALAPDAVIVDCDVETPDLHIVLDPQDRPGTPFIAGQAAWIRPNACTACGKCAELCRYDAIGAWGPPTRFADRSYVVATRLCEGCRVCAAVCPTNAIDLVDVVGGTWGVSPTRHGRLVHAKLKPGVGNSGKLVALLRREARRVAEAHDAALVICDGAAGVGCPVIATVGGASLALIVAEPSVVGRHDFERAVELTRHFRVPAIVAINRYDLAPEQTRQVEDAARSANMPVIGRVPYDDAVIAAQHAGRSVVEYGDGPAAPALHEIWNQVAERLASMSPVVATKESE